MEDLRLVRPDKTYEKIALEMKQEFFSNGETVINGGALIEKMEYFDWLINTVNNSRPETVRNDWVVSSTYFVERVQDERVIGMVDIRHTLDNSFLKSYGGNIGYSVRPSERHKGYGIGILKMALDYSRTIGLTSVMLGCYADNIASIRTIEACGGIEENKECSLHGRRVKKYCITL